MYRYCPICGHVHEVRTISKPLTENINGVNVPYQGRVYFCQFRKAPNAENEYVSMLMQKENHEEALKVYEKMQNNPI